jgi:Toastrack DUF4097
MVTRRLPPTGLVLVLLAAAGPVAAQQEDDTWLRQCRHENWGDRQNYCEVRHTGFRLSGATLRIDPDRNGGVEVAAWDRDSVAVAARIRTGAPEAEEAQDLVRAVRIEAEGSTIRVAGPGTGHGRQWSVGLVVMVPRQTGLDVETVNGPLSVEGVTGPADLRSQNGPVELLGLGGDVHARVQNGPLRVELAGLKWNGSGLDAEAVNGPVDLSIPKGYNAELETGTVNGPVDIQMPITVTLHGRLRDRLHTTLGQGGPPVRVVTTNGPFTLREAR